MLVLGIETSCDETGIALYDSNRGAQGEIVADALYSQVAMHAEYGGVVPELASRDHIRKTTPLIRQVLKDANALLEIFAKDEVGIVVDDGGRLVGIVTKMDLVDHLTTTVSG